MAIDFPNSPQVNDTFTLGDRVWRWTGLTWDSIVTTTVVGPTGPQGPQGPQGPIGQTPTIAYTHTQNAVSSTWTIIHNLGFYPNVITLDSAGTIIEGSIAFDTVNQITVSFSISTSGIAHLS